MLDSEKDLLEIKFNKKYSNKIRKMEEKAFLRGKKMELRQIRKQNRVKLGLTTTKLISFYLFVLFNVILVYAMVAMWHFNDISMLNVIITDIAGQILVFGIYSVRAYMDTRSEENIKLEREKLNSLPKDIREKVGDMFDKDENYESEQSEDSEESDSDNFMG